MDPKFDKNSKLPTYTIFIYRIDWLLCTVFSNGKGNCPISTSNTVNLKRYYRRSLMSNPLNKNLKAFSYKIVNSCLKLKSLNFVFIFNFKFALLQKLLQI